MHMATIPKKSKVTIAVDPDVLRRVDRMADAQRLSRSAMIQRACEEMLEGSEGLVKAFSNPLIRDALLGAFKDREVLRQMAASMGQKLSDRQLDLFAKGLEAAGKSGERR